jgi:hypothetical protein
MERKIQQQTLSIRVPETLRSYLERARVVLSGNANRDVSMSDVAKFLLGLSATIGWMIESK